MKKIILLTIFLISAQVAFGQACGIYRIKYTGTIISESSEIKSIKLPTTGFLEGVRKFNSKSGFVEYNVESNKIKIGQYDLPIGKGKFNKKSGKFELSISSHLTGVNNTAESLFRNYKEENKRLPVLISIKNAKSIKKRRVNLSWKDIQIKKITNHGDDNGFGNLFEINLGEIKID